MKWQINLEDTDRFSLSKAEILCLTHCVRTAYILYFKGPILKLAKALEANKCGQSKFLSVETLFMSVHNVAFKHTLNLCLCKLMQL